MNMEPSTTPRRSSRRNSFSSRSSSSHKKESKNPYSMSGLDKFSALLAELEEKKQKIYSRVNPEEISLVRFVYKDSDDCVPIVVKMKKKDKQDRQENTNIKLQRPPRNQDSDHQLVKDKFPLESSSSIPENKQVKQSDDDDDDKMKRSRIFYFSWDDLTKLSNWRRPCYYLPAVIVLILLFLVFFGRSFAILCTTIGWYIVPTLKSKASESNQNVVARSVDKKKDYVRIYIDHSGTLKKHDHQKSW